MLAQDFETESLWLEPFETEEALKNWKAIGAGLVELSSKRSKIGEKSLKWTYEKGSALRLVGCDALAKLNEYPGAQGIKVWIYNEIAMDDQLVIKIGKAALITSAPAYRFTFGLNFHGWRAIWIRVNVSAQTAQTHVLSDMDAMQIEAPLSRKKGILYLDALEVMESVSYLLCPDFQAPYLPSWSTGLQYITYQKIPTKTKETVLTEEQRNAFAEITKRLDAYILPENINFAALNPQDPVRHRYENLQCEIQKKIKEYDSFQIHREPDGSIAGPGLLAGADMVKYEHHLFRDFEKIWIALVLDYKMNHHENSLEKLMDLFDYFYDQGWAEGSGCGAMRFDEIRGAGYAYAVYMMRKELKECGRLDRELATLRWRSEFGMAFSYDDPEFVDMMKITCDKVRGEAVFQILYILSMEDSPLKALYMKQYLAYIQYIIEPKPAFENVVKSDYTVWNHQGPYMSAYGLEAMNILCYVKYLVHGTCFDLDDASTETLYEVLRTYRRSSNKLGLPVRLRGRMPAANNTMLDLAVSYAFMASCGNQEMAEIFLDIWDFCDPKIQENFFGKLPPDVLPDGKLLLPDLTWLTTPGQFVLYQELLRTSKENGWKAAKRPNGHWVYPYGGYCIWRKKDWMLAMSGWSSYIWDYENGAVENQYGRYMNYGTAMVIPAEGFVAGGIDTEHGWDWCRWPGATTKHLEESELQNNEEMRYQSSETFLGGISTEFGDGIYGMKLHDAHFDKSFRANKSWFAFGDEMICLGSDISCDDKDHMIETTLFQNAMGDRDASLQINGVWKDQTFGEEVFDQEASVWLMDSCGNGYVIPNGKGLVVEKRRKKSKTNRNKDCEGNTVAAYLQHGMALNDAGYEYVILPQATQQEVKQAACNPEYQILRKDSHAHIVRRKTLSESEEMIGYVIFSADTVLEEGILRCVDTPCLVLERKLAKNDIILYLADPDLRANDSGAGVMKKDPEELIVEQMHPMILRLRGHWIISGNENTGVTVTYDQAETILQVGCVDGKQRTLHLKYCI